MRLSQGRTSGLERYIALAQGAADRAAALTHRLLAFARRQTLDPRPIQVNQLIVDMEELIRRTVGPAISLKTMLAADLSPTLCDPSQLENALLNLCINARDAMPDGGRLTIKTENTWVDGQAARERNISPGSYVAISVTDMGTGMPSDVVARAFDPFFTTKPLGQGTGLGLSMVYGFARQSNGKARIYSEVGRGTTVRILLPSHEANVQDEELKPEQPSMPKSETGGTVLVIDDEPAVLTLITEFLGEMGFATIEAEDGSSGLHILRSGAKLELLITDVGLPGGMNGRQVADAAREIWPELKVLFITGYAETAVLGQGDLKPGMYLLIKPFTMESLAQKISAILTESYEDSPHCLEF
jgi:CheY-like chemotaxis protein